MLSSRLRRDISLGLIRPGERLNVEALKRDHKVSHPSVREALSLLVGEGYVTSSDNKGFRVTTSSIKEQRDSTIVRAELECLAFGWSLDNATTDWRAGIVATHYALTEVEPDMIDDPVSFALEWDQRNEAFHVALIANCGSPKMLEVISTLYAQSRRYRLVAHSNRSAVPDRKRWIKQSSGEHSALKEAALSGDVTTGQQILKAHIIKAVEELPRVLAEIAKSKGNKDDETSETNNNRKNLATNGRNQC